MDYAVFQLFEGKLFTFSYDEKYEAQRYAHILAGETWIADKYGNEVSKR